MPTARSHLADPRRLVDGPNHDVVPFGTVWLPLPHLALLPFVWSRELWSSGVATIPIDIACLVIEALSLARVEHDASKRVAWLAVVLLLANPSILYLHTTALTEPVLFASLLVTVAVTLAEVGEHRQAVLRRWSTRSTAVFAPRRWCCRGTTVGRWRPRPSSTSSWSRNGAGTSGATRSTSRVAP